MDEYFESFGGVRDYLHGVVDEARRTGFTETLLGRRRYLPDLTSDNRQRREMAERMALNAPIQGSAADIIKVAMLRVDAALTAQGLASRMLLQVHDELVFEAGCQRARGGRVAGAAGDGRRRGSRRPAGGVSGRLAGAGTTPATRHLGHRLCQAGVRVWIGEMPDQLGIDRFSTHLYTFARRHRQSCRQHHRSAACGVRKHQRRDIILAGLAAYILETGPAGAMADLSTVFQGNTWSAGHKIPVTTADR